MSRPNSRTQFIHCRVTDAEREQIETMILSLDARRARKLAEQITERLGISAPFSTVSDFLRVCCGLDPLRDADDAATGRPKSKTPSRAALHQRAARGDEEARQILESMGVKQRAKRSLK